MGEGCQQGLRETHSVSPELRARQEEQGILLSDCNSMRDTSELPVREIKDSSMPDYPILQQGGFVLPGSPREELGCATTLGEFDDKCP